jgi:hypothetical protein
MYVVRCPLKLCCPLLARNKALPNGAKKRRQKNPHSLDTFPPRRHSQLTPAPPEARASLFSYGKVCLFWFVLVETWAHNVHSQKSFFYLLKLIQSILHPLNFWVHSRNIE